MATHSSILAWRVPRTEEPGVLQSMGSQRVGHDGATELTRCSTETITPRFALCFVEFHRRCLSPVECLR